MILEYDIPYGTPAWYQFRTVGNNEYPGGIGASEMGKLLGLDQYRPCTAEVFHHKVGTLAVSDVSNIAMEAGLLLEKTILDLWSFWQGNDEANNILCLRNYRLHRDAQVGVPVRQYGRINKYLVNERWPWLFCSLDGYIQAGQCQANGEVLKSIAPLEAKSIGYYQASQWENGIPPKYAVQVQQQMLITESPYAELVMWEDARKVRVYEFHTNDKLVESILQSSYEFWQRVVQGRTLFAKIGENAGDELAKEQIWAEIASIEPDPDSSDAYQEYYAEKMNKKGEVVLGTAVDYLNALRYRKMTIVINKLTQIKQLYRNCLTQSMVRKGSSGINFGNNTGKVLNSGSFNVNMKNVDEDEVGQIITNIVREVIK